MKRSNLEAWMKLKDAIIDVGYKYTLRITLFTSIMFFLVIFYLIFFLIVFFKLIKFSISPVLYTLGIFDICTVMSIILIIIRLGASINQQWDKEIGLLLSIKNHMTKVLHDYES